MRRLAASSALAGLLSASLALGQSRAAESQRAERVDAGELDAPVAESNEELNLSVGENHTLAASGVRSYSEGARGIVDVRLTPDGGQFVIVGEKPGTTTLLLIKKDRTQVTYTINVSQRPMRSVERELTQLLNGTTGVRIRRVGARFFIEGGVSTEPELKRIEQIAALFPGQVESLVVLGGAAAEHKLNVRVDFLFVQFDRSKTYNFGITMPARIGGPNIASFSGTFDFLAHAATAAQATIVNQPLPGLDIAATRGWAKVLKHSTVITENGAEAKFASGGEQNYIVSSGLSAALKSITFGTSVTVLPRFDPETRQLEVKVEAEVTDLTPPVAAGAELPGRNVSNLTTKVELKLGESIVLSGIQSRSRRHNVNGLPLLSEIPVLGVLFGSHADAMEEVEGVIFVVPSVIESVPRGARQLLDGALKQYDEFSGDLSEQPLLEDPAPALPSALPPAAVRVR